MNNKTPARAYVIVLKQILNLIPREMISRHARETGVNRVRCCISTNTPLFPGLRSGHRLLHRP